jgi:sucrose-phosphate synthase
VGTNDAPHLVLISPHGLIRGKDLELGRDADTGGQTKYVVELARALAERPDVGRVDLVTRLVRDEAVHPDYARPEEPLSPKARIVRLECGPPEYLRKEQLWDHLDVFADNLLQHLQEGARPPSLVHAHYADAGRVGTRISHQLGIPLVFTGHSLGRVKRRRLLAAGVDREELETRYRMSRRIGAEEATLSSADLVVVSSQQEIDQQYDLYDNAQPDRMAVIPPGIDPKRFHPPRESEDTHEGEDTHAIEVQLRRFLSRPGRPFILALSRPDERKNLARLLEAYGESPDLREAANLVIVAGTRGNVLDMEGGPRRVMTGLLLLIDKYDLYGLVAYPKHHDPDDVPRLYRLAARTGGVFVNPALTEPFGLTLIEAAGCGLPIVATEDGGPQEIVRNCRNGVLVDPLDPGSIRDGLLRVLRDPDEWDEMARNGIHGVRAHYSWRSHAESYVRRIRPLVEGQRPLVPVPAADRPAVEHDRAFFTDLDQNLLGDPDSIGDLVALLRKHRRTTIFGVATGRSLDQALAGLREHAIPLPDVLITDTGTAIHYAPRLSADAVWAQHIDHLWNPRSVMRRLRDVPGLELQEKKAQSRFKISYYVDAAVAPSLEEIREMLLEEEQTVNVILSFGQFLDILPIRASKGFALRYVADRWNIPLERVLVAGGSGADEDMMRGVTLAAVVANRHEEELSRLVDIDRIHFAKESFARGILEAIEHYDLFGKCRVPVA